MISYNILFDVIQKYHIIILFSLILYDLIRYDILYLLLYMYILSWVPPSEIPKLDQSEQ